jgi:hypothetical protein
MLPLEKVLHAAAEKCIIHRVGSEVSSIILRIDFPEQHSIVNTELI